MKSLKLFSMAVLALVFSLQVHAQSAADEAKAFYTASLEMFNSADYDGFLATISDNFEGYAGVVTPFRFTDKSAWAAFINGMKGLAAASYVQNEATFRSVSENTVVCNSYFIFTTVAKDGTVERQSGRESTVLVKEEGGWKIVNDHFSAIF